jgi:large subunit ribosomal protein L29
LRFRSATETLEDPLRIRALRKDIARLHTVLREKQLTASAGQR